MSVSCGSCVLSRRSLFDGLIPLQEQSYRLWFVIVCDPESQEWGVPGPRWAVPPEEMPSQTYLLVINKTSIGKTLTRQLCGI